MDTQASDRQRKWALLLSAGVLSVCLLGTMSCVGSHMYTNWRRIQSRPIVVHVGQVAFSAELTYTPQCAPLVETCWPPHYRSGRPRYFSAWIYTISPPNTPWEITSRRVIMVRVGKAE